MIDALMKKIGDELKINPYIEYSSTGGFKAVVTEVSMTDALGNHLPNFVWDTTPEKALLKLYGQMKASIISVSSYPKDEEYSFCGNQFKRVNKVLIGDFGVVEG